MKNTAAAFLLIALTLFVVACAQQSAVLSYAAAAFGAACVLTCFAMWLDNEDSTYRDEEDDK